MREFSSTYLALCEGQSKDIDAVGAQLLDGDAHEEMVRKKTAELLGSALALGAMCATRDARVITALRRFGVHLGMAYQAKDDLLEITGDERKLGKRPGADLRNGRRTYLTMAYPEVDTAAGVHALVVQETSEAIRQLGGIPPSMWRDQCESLALMLVEREA
jgi:geranylgeranyl diphosphate synthase type II